MIAHNRLTFGEAEADAARDVVMSGRWAGGSMVTRLEAQMAARAGVAYGIGVASGLSALRLSLMALGVGEGDTVVVPAYSCVALPNAVLALGGIPVPVDVRAGDWNLDPDLVASAGRKAAIKAVVAVHLFGAPCPISPLRADGIPVVEDCAHAFGLPGLGSQGDISMVSLYATKLVAAGEGGMVLTSVDRSAEFVRAWRDYADRPAHRHRFNDKMTDLEAALALCQLDRLDAMLERRVHLAKRYLAGLAPYADRIALPRWSDKRVWYRFVVEGQGVLARDLKRRMAAKGVQVAMPVEDWWSGEKPDCPVANHAYRHLVSLPLYPTLTEAEQDLVISALIEACREGGIC